MAYNNPKTLSLIATGTANNSATYLEFTSKITTSFTTYYVEIRNLLPATDNVTMDLTFSTNNGSSYLATNYGYAYHNTTSQPASTSTGSNSAASAIFCSALSNGASTGFSADMYLYNVDTTTPMHFKGMGSHYNTSSYLNHVAFAGFNSGTTAVTAIKFTLSSGNMVSGTIRLYGVKEDGI